ncbi:O-antigen ligase [Halobacillus sp. KGW1]|uniref:O-antigen ligase family protein n=1 Tax=Halobacillus sp. KGW1 TaxID=1793726 RepID=UPI000AE93356|nr:O-antigen ligase family protein [Halobacillus sp. KGW1]
MRINGLDSVGTNQRKTQILLMFFLVTMANYNIYIGFALKPYMLFCFILLLVYFQSIRLVQLQLFEVAMLVFYSVYALSGAFALYSISSLRIVIGIMLYLFCYFIIKSLLEGVHTSLIGMAIGYAGVLFNSISLVLYVVGLKRVGFYFDTGGERVIELGLMIDRNYPRLIGVLQDPNFFVFYNTMFFAYYLCNTKGFWNKLGLMLCLTTNVLTFSRGGIVIMVVLTLFYILFQDPMKQWKKILGLVISFTLASFVAIYFLHFDLLSILDSRMKDFSADGGSGRLELWGRAWGYFQENPWTGIGAFNFADYNWFEYGTDLSVHNTFLDVLSDAGLIGILFYFLFLSLCLFQMVLNRVYKKQPYLFLTFVGMVLQMAFLSVIINDIFFLFLAILSTFLNQDHVSRNSSSNVRTNINEA